MRRGGPASGRRTAANAIVLTNGDVHVWLISALEPPVSPDQLSATLSPAEARRAERLVRTEDRERFVIGRGLLRRLLASCMSMEPRHVELADGPHGKPCMAPGSGRDELQFNVAHSGAWIAIALAAGRAVGVDIEQIRVLADAEALAARFFSASEAAALNRQPAALRLEAFFACWTRKEAILKAVGAGLTFPLDRFEVTVDPTEPPRVVSVGGFRDAASGWTLANLSPGAGYIGAVATFGAHGTPTVRRWTTADGELPTPRSEV
jgi:4'-phosphopantetheinyl transferase